MSSTRSLVTVLLAVATAGAMALGGAPAASAAKAPPALATPTGVSASAEPGTLSMNVTWSAVTGATGYTLRRYDAKGSKFTSYPSDGGSITAFQLQGLPSGATYRFSVIARGNGTTSSDSRESAKVSATVNTAMGPTIPSLGMTGTPAVGQILTPSISYTGLPTPSVTYTWTSGGTWVSDQGIYTVQASDAGQTIQLTATASNGYGTDAVATTTASIAPISPTIGNVELDGYAVAGLGLAARVSGVTGAPTPSLSYSWKRGTTPVSTDLTYAVTDADIGSVLTFSVTATNVGGSVTTDVLTTTVTASRTALKCLATGTREGGAPCQIGDEGPGGGTIFMLPNTGDNATSAFFEVAPADADSSLHAMCSGQQARLLSWDIGQGAANTVKLLAFADCQGAAHTAPVATAYRGGGLSDWYLGSYLEMKALRLTPNAWLAYNNWSAITATSTNNDSRGDYAVWASNSGCASATFVCTTYQDAATTAVRPIRSFTAP